MTAAGALLLARAEPGLAASVARFEAAGFAVVACPTARVATTTQTPPALAGVDALAFTSANGVAAFAELSPERALPVFAVGDTTAEAARRAGFLQVESAAGDATSLLELILAAAPGRVLHLRGLDASGDLAGDLSRAGASADEAVIYRAEPVETLCDGARLAAREGGLAGVALYSRKGAERLAELLRRENAARLLALPAAVLSPAVGEAWTAAGGGPVSIAARPEETALIRAARDLS